MTAKNKVLFSIGFLIVFVVSIISVVGYYQINTSSINSYQNNLSSSGKLITKALEQKVKTYFTSLDAIASSLKEENGKVIINERTIKSIIKERQNLNVANYFIGLPDGSMYDSVSKGLHPTFNAVSSQREWYVKGMTGIRAITKPFKASSGQMSISFVVPVKSNGKVIAMVGASLFMDDLTQYINELAQEREIFVARGDGFLMAAYDSSLIGENLFKIRPSFKDYEYMESSHHTYSSLDQEEFYVVSNKSEALNWTVWEQVNWNVIQATSKNAVITNILVGSLFILVGVLVVSVLVQRLIYIPIGGEPKDIENLVNRIANGDLTDIPLVNDKNVGVYRSTLIMAEKLKRMINDINASATNLVQVSNQLEKSSLKVDDSSKSQMLQLELIATAMNEMTVTVEEVARNAVEASSSSSNANESSHDGLQIVEQMNLNITNLADDIAKVQESIKHVHLETENVGGILDVIRGIADQTNLLALNAAIEAARAGEHGRGFAVVADEVRSLATKTQQSTNEIQSMIEGLQEQATKSVLLMATNTENAQNTLDKSHEAAQAISKIQCDIEQILDMNHQIATAAEEQAHVSNEININIIEVNNLAKATELDVKDNVIATESLKGLANTLNSYVNMFKL